MLNPQFKKIVISSLLLLGLSALSAAKATSTAPFIFVYPKGSPIGPVTTDLLTTMFKGYPNQIGGSISKIYDIATFPFQGYPKHDNNGDFYISQFKSKTTKTYGYYGMINAPADNFPYTADNANTIVSDLKHEKTALAATFSAIVLDIESVNQGTADQGTGRCNFFTTLVKGINTYIKLPVYIYISPNTAKFTPETAQCLNAIIPGSSNNRYLLALYDGSSSKNINNAINSMNINKSPYQLIVNVSSQDSATQLEKLDTSKLTKQYYKGIVLYQAVNNSSIKNSNMTAVSDFINKNKH